jgi:hypothetical protein
MCGGVNITGWAAHTARTAGNKNGYKIFVIKPEKKEASWKP